MSDGITVIQQVLTDSVEPLRKLRDQLEANRSSIQHNGLDTGTRRRLAAIHRSLLAMAEKSTGWEGALGGVMGLISDPRLTMEPEMLLGELDDLIASVESGKIAYRTAISDPENFIRQAT